MREAFQAYDQSGGYLKKLYIYIYTKKKKQTQERSYS